jgi:catechol 2,3-dioxygenase-like lactoylglutathione lyase family enzyme
MNMPTRRMLLEAAVEQLYSQCRESGYCDVLLDPQAGSPFGEQIAALDEHLAPCVHLRDALFADAPQDAPMLLRLPLSELPLLEAMAAHAQQEATDPSIPLRSVCGFFQSTELNERVASRLGWALNLKVERQGIYFRYFDPRVFLHLSRLLPADTLGQLLRGISTWSYFLWDGSFAVQEVPETNSPMPIDLRLTSKQWQTFEAIEYFNATQRLFAKHGLPFEPAQTAELFAQVQAARALGLPTPDDTAHYLACNHQVSTPLSQHPAWPDVLMLLKQEVPLAEALAQLCSASLRAG